MSYLYELFFVLIFIFIMINCEYRHTCSCAYFIECVLLFLDDNVDEECE